MKTHLAVVLVAGMLGIAAAALNSSALADEEEISLKKVPAPIQRALEGVKVAEIDRETNTVYEVELRVGRHEIVLILSPDGKLLGVEIEEADDEGDAGRKSERNDNGDEDDENEDEDEDEENGDEEQAESERAVTQAEVPAAALATLKKLAAGAKINAFAEEIEHGHTFYEGSWQGPSGANVDVLVTATGNLVETEEQVSADQVPKAVLAAARKAAGEGAKLGLEKKTMVLYEVKFRKGNRGHELLLAPEGRVVETEVEQGKVRGDEDEDDDEVGVRKTNSKTDDEENEEDDDEDGEEDDD